MYERALCDELNLVHVLPRRLSLGTDVMAFVPFALVFVGFCHSILFASSCFTVLISFADTAFLGLIRLCDKTRMFLLFILFDHQSEAGHIFCN